MLDLIDENDEKGFFDSAFTPPLWLYADGIKLGYEISKENETKLSRGNKKIGDPTAYATIIEARFSADLDKVDEQLRQEYLKNKEFKLIKSIK
ncbi:hypothetical protein [Campylobacter sp. S4:11]|uniref:hypothetical protein n=1 Tax=Campylobacter sp. S4:11 TaxID=2735745 RepID=UPI00301E0D09|nr:hypothetical protein [Campylobacter sp. S4:11]